MSGRLLEEFPPVPTAEWEEAIRRDLKGADYGKKLVWRSDEGIAVKPYYRAEDLDELAGLDAPPGVFPYRRGTRTSNQWRIRETVRAGDVAAARQRARAALAAGAGEIEFVVGPGGLELAGAEDIAALVAGFDCAVHFAAGGQAGALVPLLAEALPRDIEGSLDYDPVPDGEATIADLGGLIDRAPEFRPLTVRAHVFHDVGATAVQELGYGLAAAIGYMEELTARGIPPAKAAAAIGFSFGAGSNFFFEIAKLRAARMLWARAAEAFGAPAGEVRAAVHSRTSLWNRTIYDPYVNLLRGATGAMSAAMGGCDSLSVAPFDVTYREPDDFSRRLARNTQLILKHEAWLDRAVDPAGGSYYVEALTDALARESWRTMQEVEAAGGFRNVWAEGVVSAEIARSRVDKEDAVAQRRRTIVGTNQYPDARERALERLALRPEDRITLRAAQVFEEIRLRTERHAAAGGRVPVFLLMEIGNPVMRAARSGFAANLFGCAGFETRIESFADVAGAAARAAADGADAMVLCSSDEEYPAIAREVCPRARAPVIVAGYPKDTVALLREAGVADFVHLRADAAATLRGWQERLGVSR